MHLALGIVAPPKDIRLLHANKNKLVFTWECPCNSCPDIQYNINTSNCGECPQTTATDLLTCIVSITTIYQTCLLSIESGIYNGTITSISVTASILVKG